MPALPALPLPEREAATMAPAPRISAMIDAVVARRNSSRKRERWPPAMWPVSCASTPITWFGISASIIVPALMKMRRPSATNALNERELMITTWMFCCARPAAFRIGWVYSRSSCSISASRMIGGPPPRRGCACAGLATQWLAAIASEATIAVAWERRRRRGVIVRFGQGHAELKFRGFGLLRARCRCDLPLDNTLVCRAHPAWNWPHCA